MDEPWAQLLRPTCLDGLYQTVYTKSRASRTLPMDSYEWSEWKARSNRNKHGVTFEEALSVFDDPLAFCIADTLNSHRQDRYLLLGMSSAGRLLVVCYREVEPEVEEDGLRLISARRATRLEGKSYQEGRGRAHILKRDGGM